VQDFAATMDTARRQGWALVALDLGVDTTTPAGELVANVMAAVAQWERRVIGQRTADALAAKKAQGVRLGGPITTPKHVRERVVALAATGASHAVIARALNADRVHTASGTTWHRSGVRRVLRSHALDLAAAEARASIPSSTEAA
jgi:DNA invertase Pin-like site-specific DNA recombinase